MQTKNTTQLFAQKQMKKNKKQNINKILAKTKTSQARRKLRFLLVINQFNLIKTT